MRYRLRTLLIAAMLGTAALAHACQLLDSQTGAMLVGFPVDELSRVLALRLLEVSVACAVFGVIALLISDGPIRRGFWCLCGLAYVDSIALWLLIVPFVQSAT
jgi:hypothetical protein